MPLSDSNRHIISEGIHQAYDRPIAIPLRYVDAVDAFTMILEHMGPNVLIQYHPDDNDPELCLLYFTAKYEMEGTD